MQSILLYIIRLLKYHADQKVKIVNLIFFSTYCFA